MFPISTFLISIGAISALTAFLSILMVLADATIGNYGEVNITINKDKELEVKGGRPLLGTLMDEGIFIPSACGGRGSCGLCKVKLVSGAGQYLPTELPWLSEEEKGENIRLSCQLKVKKALSIQLPEELFNIKEFRAGVAGIRDLTHDIKEITLELLAPEEIDFKAGQFIQLKAPEYELTDVPVYRAYSLASIPSSKIRIELEIRLVSNGICTTYVHKYLKEGDEITFNGPYGEFYLRDSEKDIVFIAGGSGMAPIKSILLDMAEKEVKRKTSYFFGARSGRDLFLLDEMKELEAKLLNFSFIPALSEPQAEDNWDGETGFVTDVLARYLSSKDNLEAYLCGSPGMIEACLRVLAERDVPEELIYYDKFG